MGERTHDREDLTEALELVLKAFPSAVLVDLSTTDQGRFGFNLYGVQVPDEKTGELVWLETDVKSVEQLAEDVWHLVSSLGWDGLVGEDYHGTGHVNIAEKLRELRSAS